MVKSVELRKVEAVECRRCRRAEGHGVSGGGMGERSCNETKRRDANTHGITLHQLKLGGEQHDTQYCTTPFCFGPPISPHHPIYPSPSSSAPLSPTIAFVPICRSGTLTYAFPIDRAHVSWSPVSR